MLPSGFGLDPSHSIFAAEKDLKSRIHAINSHQNRQVIEDIDETFSSIRVTAVSSHLSMLLHDLKQLQKVRPLIGPEHPRRRNGSLQRLFNIFQRDLNLFVVLLYQSFV